MNWHGFGDGFRGNVRLQSLHLGMMENGVPRDDGSLSDGFSPPSELKYSYGVVKMKMKPKPAMSVLRLQCPIRYGAKLYVPLNVGEPYAFDGSPPPSPEYAASTDEACRLMWNDGFPVWILTVVSATDGSKPAVTRDGFLKMTRLPVWTDDGAKPVVMMNLSVMRNDGSHR